MVVLIIFFLFNYLNDTVSISINFQSLLQSGNTLLILFNLLLTHCYIIMHRIN